MRFSIRGWSMAILALGALVALLVVACGQATPTPTPAPPTATPTRPAATATPTIAAPPPVTTPAAATPTKTAGTPTTPTAGGPPKIPVATGHIEPTPGLDCLMCHSVGGAGVGAPGGSGMPSDHQGRTKDVCQGCHTK